MFFLACLIILTVYITAPYVKHFIAFVSHKIYTKNNEPKNKNPVKRGLNAFGDRYGIRTRGCMREGHMS